MKKYVDAVTGKENSICFQNNHFDIWAMQTGDLLQVYNKYTLIDQINIVPKFNTRFSQLYRHDNGFASRRREILGTSLLMSINWHTSNNTKAGAIINAAIAERKLYELQNEKKNIYIPTEFVASTKQVLALNCMQLSVFGVTGPTILGPFIELLEAIGIKLFNRSATGPQLYLGLSVTSAVVNGHKHLKIAYVSKVLNQSLYEVGFESNSATIARQIAALSNDYQSFHLNKDWQDYNYVCINFGMALGMCDFQTIQESITRSDCQFVCGILPIIRNKHYNFGWQYDGDYITYEQSEYS